MYIDFLPDEIIRIIIMYCNKETINNLILLDRRYERIYLSHINNVKNGNIFNFELLDFVRTKMDTYTNDKSYDNYNVHISTSSYFDKRLDTGPEYTNFIKTMPKEPLTKIINNIRYLIYFDYNYKRVDKKFTILYLNENSKYTLLILRYIGNFIPVESVETHEDNNWKDIWNRLAEIDRKALLYQRFGNYAIL